MPRAAAASSTVRPAKYRSLTSSAVGRVLGGQPVEGLVEGEQVVVRVAGRPATASSRSTRRRPPPCLTRPLAAGGLDEDAAHGLGGGGEEVAAAVPAGWPASAPTSRRYASWTRAVAWRVWPGLLGGQPGGGELAQLVVDEREQLGGGLRVAGRGGVEEAGDVGHAAEHTPAGRRRNRSPGPPPQFRGTDRHAWKARCPRQRTR